MADGSTASNVGKIGITGIVKTVHGAGEVIRGNIASFIDGVGEGITGRDGTVPASAPGGHGTNVATEGLAEFRQGLAELKGGANKNRAPNVATATDTNTGLPMNQPPTKTSTAAPPETATVPSKTTSAPGQQNPTQTQPASYAATPRTATASTTTNNVPVGDQRMLGQQNTKQMVYTGAQGTGNTSNNVSTGDPRIIDQQNSTQKPGDEDVGANVTEYVPPRVTSRGQP